MSTTQHLFAIHTSHGGTESMHAFGEAIKLEDGEKTESYLSRFKDKGFLRTEPEISAASETSIYVPITEEAFEAFRDFSWLMLQLDKSPSRPFQYKSAFEPMPENGFNAQGLNDAGEKLNDLYKQTAYINCVDMLILSALVSGIDLNSVFGQTVNAQSQNLKTAIEDTPMDEIARENGYSISASRDPNRQIIVARSLHDAAAGGPKDAFNAVSPYLSKLDDAYAFYADQAELPTPIMAAATRTAIPSTLRRQGA